MPIFMTGIIVKNRRSVSPYILNMAEPRDLMTMLYKPRETIRRVLDDPRPRWTVQLVILAFICSSFGDPDIRHLGRDLPDLTLGPMLALIVVLLVVIAICWVIGVYLIGWLVTLAGRLLDGKGTAADVRTALAWALVPLILTPVYRIPVAIYRSTLKIHGTSGLQVSIDMLQQGAISVALVIAAIQIAFDLWVVYLASANVGEAMRFETWKGFSALAIVAAVPIVVTTAAILAFHH